MLERENDFPIITDEEVGKVVTIKREFVVEVENPTPENPQGKKKEPKEMEVQAKILSFRKSKTETEGDPSDMAGEKKPKKYPMFAYINPVTGNTIIEEPVEAIHPLFGRHIRYSRVMLTGKGVQRLIEFTMTPKPTETPPA